MLLRIEMSGYEKETRHSRRLMAAAESGDVITVGAVLNQGADANIRDPKNFVCVVN